ncbi:MAG: type III-A CRISPR-associated protein Csm2 [Desulfobacteraceae bacterium]|jgi:CRISPR-associated protein Csm2
MSVFYKDREKGIIEPKLFSDIAMTLADKIHEEGQNKANKRSQLRKFFDEVVRLNSLANNKNNTEQWEQIEPYVNMLIAKAAYAEGKGSVTKEFAKLIKDAVNEIRGPKDLNVFTSFFEAFMGFYRKYGEN